MIRLVNGLYVVLLLSAFLSLSGDVFAQTKFTDFLDNLPGAQIDLAWLFGILGSIACNFIRFALIAIGIMIVVYGIMAIKGMGAPQELSNVKTSLTWGIVGAMVIYGVFTIVLSLADIIGVSYPILNIVKCS